MLDQSIVSNVDGVALFRFLPTTVSKQTIFILISAPACSSFALHTGVLKVQKAEELTALSSV